MLLQRINGSFEAHHFGATNPIPSKRGKAVQSQYGGAWFRVPLCTLSQLSQNVGFMLPPVTIPCNAQFRLVTLAIPETGDANAAA